MGKPEHFDLQALAPASAIEPRRSPTPHDIAELMRELAPAPSGRPGDQCLPRQQLSSAFLAGVAQAQEDFLLLPPGSLVRQAIGHARSLLKNRAADPASRVQDAFKAGARTARMQADFDAARAVPRANQALKLFVRQPLTESGAAQQALIGEVLRRLEAHNGRPRPFDYLAGRQAERADTFKTAFEAESGQAFTPRAFRQHRLQQLRQADAFVNIRAGMSESSAFELSYHVFRGACTPVLFLVWKQAPIKTTLLKELGDLCDVTYLEFDEPAQLEPGIERFFRRLSI
jgi:hypothetical protein